MLRGAPVCGAAGVRALGPRPQRLLPLLLPPVLRGGAPLGAGSGLLSPWACADGRARLPALPRRRGRWAGGAQSQASPWRRSFRAVWPSASGGAPRRETGPPVLLFLCLGGFSSFLCLLVSGLHFKVYNKCFGVGSPPPHFSLASPFPGRPRGPGPGGSSPSEREER